MLYSIGCFRRIILYGYSQILIRHGTLYDFLICLKAAYYRGGSLVYAAFPYIHRIRIGGCTSGHSPCIFTIYIIYRKCMYWFNRGRIQNYYLLMRLNPIYRHCYINYTLRHTGHNTVIIYCSYTFISAVPGNFFYFSIFRLIHCI